MNKLAIPSKKINFKRNKIFNYLYFLIIVIFTNQLPIKSMTIVPGKSDFLSHRNEKIREIIENNSLLKKSIEKEFLNYSLCDRIEILEEEKNLKSNSSKVCTRLYFAIATEKIWFNDEMLWELVNYRKIDVFDTKSKEICYDANLLGTGEGIKCYIPKKIMRDTKTNLPLFYEASCSDKYLNKNPKIKKDLFNNLSSYERQNPVNNHWEIDCNFFPEKGSQLFRAQFCDSFLFRGDEDYKLGLIVGKDCRERFPENIFGNENRKKVQKRIATELIRFNAEENRFKKMREAGYKDLMSNKYSIRQKKYFCMEEALNQFLNSPSFYKNYCNKLMR